MVHKLYLWSAIVLYRWLQTVYIHKWFQNTFGKHWKPPPVALSKAKERTLSGTIAANLQAIIDPVVIGKGNQN